MVLLDAPATGHALDMLQVPKVIVDVAPSGRLRRDAESAWTMLSDPEQSGVVVVTLPEELPASETLELERKLRVSFGLPVAGLVINGCTRPLFSSAEAASLATRVDLLQPSLTIGLAQLAARRAVRERVQADNLRRLEALNLPRVLLPVHADPPVGESRVQALSRYFSTDPANLTLGFG